jgi:hypothetical protein
METQKIIYNKLTIKELLEICKNNNIINVSKLKKEDLIKKIELKLNNNLEIDESNNNILEKNIEKNDLYTKNILKSQYEIHKNYTKQRIESSKELKINFRLPSIPEDISENIIKFIIHKNGDTSSSWNCSGDLLSKIEGKQECKCFTSTGPISFTPSSDWDVIYFLDAIDWINDNFKLYKFPHKKSSNIWKNIKVNKTQTFEDQCTQGRRPRINWSGLYLQIKEDCTLLFEGSIYDILN